MSARADPLIHGVMDGDGDIAALVAACRERGVTGLAASYLFLRPAIAASLKRHVADLALVERILAPYEAGVRFALRGGAGGGFALPEAIRRPAFDRLKHLAAGHGLEVHICGCKNPDLTADRCHLVQDVRDRDAERAPSFRTGLLWESSPLPRAQQ